MENPETQSGKPTSPLLSTGMPTVVLKNSRLQHIPVHLQSLGGKTYRCTYLVDEPGKCNLQDITARKRLIGYQPTDQLLQIHWSAADWLLII